MKKIFIYIKAFFITCKKYLHRNKKNNVMTAPNINIKLNDKPKETNVLDVDLIDHNLNNKDKKEIRQFTKIMVTWLTIMSCMWITYSYVLATIALVKYNNANPLSDLSKQVCVTILGVVIAYCAKSFLETFNQEKNKITMQQFNNNLDNADDIMSTNDYNEIISDNDDNNNGSAVG